MDRRQLLMIGAAAAAGSRSAWAAEWPDRPIKMVIGYPPGGATDGVARPLLAPMSKALGQPVVMDYKPGAGGATAAEVVARSAADGYTIHLIEGSVYSALPHLRKLPFDPVRALQPLGLIAVGGAVIVSNPSAGFDSIEDLVRYAKANPGQLAYGTSGMGGAQHLAAEHFQATAGVKLQHIPYKGGAPAMNDLLGGQIKLLFSSMTPAVPFIRSGKVKALGVTSLTRATALPEVRTVAEQGFSGFEAVVWLAIAAPSGLPDAVAQKLMRALATANADTEVISQIRAQGYEPLPDSATQLAQRIRRDGEKWGGIVKSAGITLDQ